MAIIGKIREKSGLLVIIIGVALLAFILGDWKSFSGGSGPQYGLGTVDGEMIDFNEYAMASENFQKQDESQAGQAGREYDAKQREASETKAFNYTVETTLLKKEYEALGIRVSDNEFDAYFYGDSTQGFQILPELKQGFTDSTGRFNVKMLQQRVEQLQNSENAEERKSWEDSKKYYIEQRQREKYFTVLNQGVYVTKLEAKEEYLAQNNTKDISFVFRNYSEIPDTDIKVSDDDMKKYFEEHKNEARFKPKANSRTINYFDIAIQPSADDSIKFNTSIQSLVTGLRNAKNDSTFVVRNSESRQYMSGKRGTAVPQGHPKAQQYSTYPFTMDTVFKTATIGQVVGPYNDNGVMKISKVVGFTPTEITARHILLQVPQGDAEAEARQKKLADSLMGIINKDNFEELVQKYSDDTGSKAQGGKMDDFLEGDMVPEFGKYTAEEPIGKIGMVKTYFGFHIIEVLERSSEKFPVLATVTKTLKSSPETMENRQQAADDVLYMLDEKLSNKKSAKEKVALFDTIARKEGFLVRPVVINDKNIMMNGFVTSLAEDKLIQLAFDETAEVGRLVGSPIRDKDRYIIAIIAQVQDMDDPKWEDFEQTLKFEVIREKKAKKFIAEMEKFKDLNTLASKFSKSVSNASVNFASAQIQGAGNEPEIVGSLFSGISDGKLTKPLKGRSGVYVVRVDKSVKAPSIANYDEQKQALLSTRISSLGNESIIALKEKYNVIDNRRFSRLNIRN